MRALERFQQAMLAAVQNQMLPVLDEHRDQLSEAIKNELFQLDGPTEVEREYTPKDFFVAKQFQGYSEIFQSLETLEDIQFYIRRFPFQGTRITRARYLQFHVECYFSEVYILRERIAAYFKTIRRVYKKEEHFPRIAATCEKLSDLTATALGGVTTARGRHVHEQRFRDADIGRLGTLALLSLSPDKNFTEIIDGHYRQAHREAKQKWSKRVSADIKAIKELLDHLFEELLPIVFEANEKNFKFPRRIEA